MSIKYTTAVFRGFAIPATFHDAVKKIKDGFEKGKVNFSSCGKYKFYDPFLERNVFCPMGYLLSQKQRDLLNEYGEDNESAIGNSCMWEHFGEKNLGAMLGMTREDAADIQTQFDELATQFHVAGKEEQKKLRAEFTQYLNDQLYRDNYENPIFLA